MRARLAHISINQTFLHGVFWLLVLILIIGFHFESTQILQSILSSVVTILSLMVLIYFNINILIPRYLRQNKIFIYVLSSIVFTLALSPIRTLVTYYIYNDHQDIQKEIMKSHWAIFFSMMAVFGISTLTKMVYDWFQRERDLRIMENENMQSELRFLRSQINPHFLFNTLNSLYALSLKKSDKTPDSIIRLSELMRYMLYDCNDKTVPLTKEIEYIRNYLELERLRHSQNVDIRFELVGETEDLVIAPLLFSPFLENAFKHGVNRHIKESSVLVSLELDGNQLHLSVINSKPKEVEIEKKESKSISGGIGLENVRRRLALLYPDAYSLDIKEDAQYYEINLKLRLNHNS